MSSKYKFLMFLFGLFISTNVNASYKPLSPSSFDALYSLATHGNVSAINNAIARGLNINSINKDGDTGLCVAAKRRNMKAFKSFIQAGANPYHPCTWEVRGYREFLEASAYEKPRKLDTAVNAKKLTNPRMSWKTKTLIGTGVIALGAGTALALGGGGGSGSGGDGVDPNCVHGTYINDICTCFSGYTGANCNTCAPGYDNYGTTNCHLTLSCDKGTQRGDQCICDAGYTGTLCSECAPGYGRNSSGVCVLKDVKIVGYITNKNINSSNINKSNYAYRDIFGMFYDASQTPHDIGILPQNQLANSYNVYVDVEVGDTNTTMLTGTGTATITLTQYSDGDAYGLYSNNAEDIFNNYTKIEGSATPLYDTINANINIQNNLRGNSYGIFGNNKIYSIQLDKGGMNEESSLYLNSAINIMSTEGNSYGIYNESSTGETYHINELGEINNLGTDYLYKLQSNMTVSSVSGDSYGIYGLGKIENSGYISSASTSGVSYGIYNKNGSVRNYRAINSAGILTDGIISSSNSGNSYSIFAENSTVTNENLIESASTDGNAYGIYAINNSTVNNTSGITAKSTNGNAYGIYGKDSNIVNSTQYYEVIVEAKNGIAYGIYGDGGSIENSGRIHVVGKDDYNAYGIYATNGATVLNKGNFLFNINGKELNPDNGNLYCDETGCKFPNGGYAIYLENGATFVNEGSVISTTSLSLPQGTQISTGGSYSSETQISGNLDVASKAVSKGFENSYTLNNAVNTPDSSNLKISSESVLFDASLQGNDIILNKKGFDKLVDNKDVAKFLEQNYAQENNEQLFTTLKSATNIKELNKLTNTLTGQNIISRFADEDLIMSRELDFDINEKLFNLPNGNFALSNNMTTRIFDDTATRTQYAISGIEHANMHFGVGLAIQDIVSKDINKNNSRHSKNFQFMTPLQFTNKGFNTVVTPKWAYAYGSYDRNGYEGKNFGGTIEKQTASLSAETRYPVKLFGLDFAPTSEINLSAYQTKISEDANSYALSSDDTTYSATFGMGAYISSSKDWAKNHKLNFMVGAMLYHEFADPYALQMKIKGMNGSFTLRDENRQANYIVLRSKFDYTKDNISLYSDFLSYADSEFRTRLDIGFKYHF